LVALQFSLPLPHAAGRARLRVKRLTVEVLDVAAAVLMVAQSNYLRQTFVFSVIESAEFAVVDRSTQAIR
jgi:hypothetical protein